MSERLVFIVTITVSLVLYAVAVFQLRLAYKVDSKWMFRPKLDWLAEQCAKWSEREMQVLVGTQCRESWEYNQPKLQEKANRINTALNYVCAEVVLVGLSGMFALAFR